MSVLELDSVEKTFGGLTAVDDVSLSVEEGELVCLLGPSGCGKSTTLRTVAGFETPDTGTIRIRGRDVTDVPPNERNCSMVFQDWALFPNKTVLENVAFGPKVDGVDRETRRDRATEMLELVEMTSQADARPDQLSGGQQQRVALARSLALDPDLLLLDEPLSNLDRKLREAMQLEIKEIQRELGTTMLYVTHDQDEAFTLADRIGIVDGGQLVQVGAPSEVYTDPNERFVESFLGTTNFLECTVADGAAPGGYTRLSTPLGEPLFAPTEGRRPSTDERVTASIRPERLSLSTEETVADGAGQSAAETGLSATGVVESRLHRGSRIRYELTVGEATLVTERRLDDSVGVSEGDTVGVGCAADAITYFDAEGVRLR